jgi:hypothetical protein
MQASFPILWTRLRSVSSLSVAWDLSSLTQNSAAIVEAYTNECEGKVRELSDASVFEDHGRAEWGLGKAKAWDPIATGVRNVAHIQKGSRAS